MESSRPSTIFGILPKQRGLKREEEEFTAKEVEDDDSKVTMGAALYAQATALATVGYVLHLMALNWAIFLNRAIKLD